MNVPPGRFGIQPVRNQKELPIRGLSFFKRKQLIIPKGAIDELSSYIDEYSRKMELPAPRLVIDSHSDRHMVIASYRGKTREIYPNTHLLAKTWGKGEAKDILEKYYGT